MGKPGPAPRPSLQVVREGNQGHHGSDRLEGGLRLRPESPAEPDWKQWWPPVRVPTVKQLEARYPVEMLEGQLAHIEDDRKRAQLAWSRQQWLVDRDRTQAQESQAENRRAREVARRTWRQVVGILSAEKLLVLLDEVVLTDVCITWARIDQCERNISRLGIWQRGERGAQKNPATTVANQLRSHLRWAVGELGLSPVARDALNAEAGGDDDQDTTFD